VFDKQQVLIGKENLTAVEVFSNYFMLGNQTPKLEVYRRVPRSPAGISFYYVFGQSKCEANGS